MSSRGCLPTWGLPCPRSTSSTSKRLSTEPKYEPKWEPKWFNARSPGQSRTYKTIQEMWDSYDLRKSLRNKVVRKFYRLYHLGRNVYSYKKNDRENNVVSVSNFNVSQTEPVCRDCSHEQNARTDEFLKCNFEDEFKYSYISFVVLLCLLEFIDVWTFFHWHYLSKDLLKFLVFLKEPFLILVFENG